MSKPVNQPSLAPRHWFSSADGVLNDLHDEIEAGRRAPGPSLACRVEQHIPIYDCAVLAPGFDSAPLRRSLQAEWVEVLLHGAGVLVLRGSYADGRVIDAATGVFDQLIAEEHALGRGGADHFAKAGANDRIWNALEKLCLRQPQVFADYYANPWLQAIAEAWLGPHYQLTSQVNVVRPGGKAQQAHRDYHLGFQTAEEVLSYPIHVHTMSPLLTLQGAVAHVDMPVESGPTKLLPFSQRYTAGYVAWRRTDCRDYFEAHCVQLALRKGDLLFFNPALFHAAGSNYTSDVARMANLLQISSAYGRAMESVHRLAMCQQLYPILGAARDAGCLSAAQIEAVIASSGEGYSFPNNLDRDPPAGGLAPPSQQALLRQALAEQWPMPQFSAALLAQARKRQTDSEPPLDLPASRS